MKKIKNGFGLIFNVTQVKCKFGCKNIELEDCKQFCLNTKDCISIGYNALSKECRLYNSAPVKGGGKIQEFINYVKSCGKLK